MKKTYTMIVKSITHTEKETDKGTDFNDTLSCANEEKGVNATIKAEEGAWDGLMIGERIEIQIFNPQTTLIDEPKEKGKKKGK